MVKSVNMKKIVRQHNDYVAAPYAIEFTSHEIKIIEYMISESKDVDKHLVLNNQNKQFEFTATALSKILKTSVSRIVADANKLSDSITTKRIIEKKFNSNGEIEEFVYIPIVTFAHYSKGMFTFAFNSYVLKHFIDINRNFTEFQLGYLLSMPSSYSIKLYKLLYQYKKFKIRTFFLIDLKEQFGILDKYAQYSDFKKFVISPSLLHINEKTDLTVYCEEIKRGRRVEKLEFRFEVKKSEKKQLPNESVIIDVDAYDSQSETNFNPSIESLLASINEDVSQGAKNKLQELYLSRGHDFIEVSISYAKKNAKTNFEKYLLDTLNNDWAVGELKKKLVKKTTAKASQQKREQLNQERDLQIEQDNINRSEIEHLFIKLPDKEQERYAEFAESIFNKHRAKLEKMHCSTESLKLSVFAVSNQRFYNKTIEIYITSMLRTSLSLNDYLC